MVLFKEDILHFLSFSLSSIVLFIFFFFSVFKKSAKLKSPKSAVQSEEKLMFLLNIRVCKPSQIISQIEIMNLNRSIMRLL